MDNAKHLQSRKIQPPRCSLIWLVKMQKIYYCTIYYLLPGIISTPVNKEIRAQMSKCTYKQFNVLWK